MIDRNLELLMSAYFELRKQPGLENLTDDQIFDRALELLDKARAKISAEWSRASFLLDTPNGSGMRGRDSKLPFRDLVMELTGRNKEDTVERVRRFLSEQFKLSEAQLDLLEKGGVSPQRFGEAKVFYDWWDEKEKSAQGRKNRSGKK